MARKEESAAVPTPGGDTLAELLQAAIDRAGDGPLRADSFVEWWRASTAARSAWSSPIDQAMISGCLADRVGYAFGAGYEAALRRLLPSIRDDRIVSLSVTEEGGGHPRAIKSTLHRVATSHAGREGWLLSGNKKWATLSLDSDELLVAASVGTDSAGRNRIRMVAVERAAAGVTVQQMPPTSFVPEISHGEIYLRDVSIAAPQILDGDGYEKYVKPFRTIEDTHVNAALLGYLMGVAARSDWPQSAREELLGLMVSLHAIGLSDPSAPTVQLALAGFFALQQRTLATFGPYWAQADPEERERWQRDADLLKVAGRARSQRREAAWRRAHPRR